MHGPDTRSTLSRDKATGAIAVVVAIVSASIPSSSVIYTRCDIMYTRLDTRNKRERETPRETKYDRTMSASCLRLAVVLIATLPRW